MRKLSNAAETYIYIYIYIFIIIYVLIGETDYIVF